MKRNFEKPFISVLIPTRGRPELLKKAVDSLYSLSRNRMLVEYLFAVDEDDTDTVELCKVVATQISGSADKVLVSPRNRGYFDIHKRYNNLAAHAAGDWLFLFNDDSIVDTDSWDHIILSTECVSTRPLHDIIMLKTRINGRFAPQFPLIRRKVFEILGHISMCPQCDLYLDSLFSLLHSAFDVPVDVKHEVPADQTAFDTKDYYVTSPEIMKSSEVIRSVITDALKLMDYRDFSFDQTGT